MGLFGGIFHYYRVCVNLIITVYILKDWADCEQLTPSEVGQKFDQLQ